MNIQSLPTRPLFGAIQRVQLKGFSPEASSVRRTTIVNGVVASVGRDVFRQQVLFSLPDEVIDAFEPNSAPDALGKALEHYQMLVNHGEDPPITYFLHTDEGDKSHASELERQLDAFKIATATEINPTEGHRIYEQHKQAYENNPPLVIEELPDKVMNISQLLNAEGVISFATSKYKITRRANPDQDTPELDVVVDGPSSQDFSLLRRPPIGGG